jgi:hypothetical protein
MNPRLLALAALFAVRCVSAQPAAPSQMEHCEAMAPGCGMDHAAHMQHAEGMDHAAHMGQASAERQADVAGRGKDVMPFDLAATLHVFTKTPEGGVQKVVARRADDDAQAKLVRAHLQEIAAQFREGNFSGPAHIHGTDMPGLQQLQAAKPGAVRVAYREVPAGAELVFTSADPKLVAAVHRWFDAQVADHGKDAQAGHGHGHMHH